MPPEREAARELLTWWGVFWVALAALAGGIVKYFQHAWKHKRPFQWREFALDTVPALLVGFIIGSACKALGIDAGMAGALSALCGHQALRVLGIAGNTLANKIKEQ